ncbi:uncharacterized protein (TIGR02231 family) [Mucilaginibacter frigoritolerans]|uniref:Uncharacterized protein (TIGR02231 family) n=2 Tax=Mucilaginibacter frigoritolerans TaxID=652788 RepID=A0A562U9J7_9SPHI|nr:uncharacterized protein (TIGR02231 family) [Mucilaginibacter frigoritolerans]
MRRKLLMVACLMMMAAVTKAEGDQKIASKVQKVIVFLNGAQVTRTAMVNVNAGTSELVFWGISPGIDVQSIQVHANGDFTILSVKNEINYLDEQVKQKQVEDLKAQQKALTYKINLQNSLLSVYQEEESMLVKNQVVTGENASLDVIKLKQALDFQTARLIELKNKQHGISDEIALLNADLQKYDKQIADILKGSSTATSNIRVTISSKVTTQSEFTLNYVVHDASWYPTYDIRAKDVNSPVSISYKANVSQQSGEDWKNIKLTLSTGNPTVSGNKPELNPYYLNFGMYYGNNTSNTVTKVSGIVTSGDDGLPLPGASIRVKGTTIGTVSATNGNFSVEVPSGAQTIEVSFVGYDKMEYPVTSGYINARLNASTRQLGEVVVTGALGVNRKAKELGYSADSVSPSYLNGLTGKVAGVVVGGAPGAASRVLIRGIASNPVEVNQIENQTNIEFNIKDPYSVPSDGKQYTVEINQLDLDATYQYAVAPKLSTDVFLSARLTDWNKYNFLSGEANLFFEGTFIGKSLLNTSATTDTLNLSLGIDKNIVVTRTSLKDLTEKQSFGSNKKETKDWLIEVKNRKNQPVNLLVEDQVPVSQNSSIEVETQDVSGGKSDQTTGKVSWNLTLKPSDDKKLELKYQVKYPKNQTVIVQ